MIIVCGYIIGGVIAAIIFLKNRLDIDREIDISDCVLSVMLFFLGYIGLLILLIVSIVYSNISFFNFVIYRKG